MIKINVHEAKTHLSRYLDRVEAGETIVLCRHNKAIAEVRPIPAEPQRKPRVAGIDKGKLTVGPEFFEPLSPEILRVFVGEGE
jgi:antitoxin (DNA-binding transcriptional repressor) of toxin-antitoxin stability system